MKGEFDKQNTPATQQAQSVLVMLEAGSAIEFGDPVRYGTIKRIEDEVAEIEMVSYVFELYS